MGPTLHSCSLTGSAVTLQFRNRSRGIRCSPQCRPKPCQIVESQSSCHEITYQFELVTVGSDTNIIKAGSKVALRSRCNPTKWLDCSGLSSECSITRCNQCRGDICTYNDYDAPCNRHYFKIFGIGRRNGRMLNSNRQIYLRHDETDSILTCEGETCNLSSEGPSEEMAQIFSITVLR